ncbi:unnamed protein product [Eruca vesicaria subsp. sativa]|uniref:Uncharacterized protein n=1 Tax=Eruca vesicaria subsp. sativa TaxID=29727 RepID=A0ABC8JYI1_ERUVS|nr:unnamed protein product [Eruca vesicaria subsp. sativa]
MTFSRHIPDAQIVISTTETKKLDVPSPPPKCCVTYLTRLIREVKRKGRLLLSATAARRQESSLQCRYNPMSYSLNFDGGACGTLPDDADNYFRCYAFSSRYLTTTAIKNRPPFLCETLSTSLHEVV